VRKSLKGEAAMLLLSLGDDASVQDISDKLDRLYGTVHTSENLMQVFYTARQMENETVASWGIRLESVLQRAIERGALFDTVSREMMLKNKFWSGLVQKQLKNATRPAFYSDIEYSRLLQAVRAIEQELQLDSTSAQPKSKIMHHSQTTDTPARSDTDISRQLAEVINRLDKLETRTVQALSPKNDMLRHILNRLEMVENQVKSRQPVGSSLPRGRGHSRRGRGNGRGSLN
jgi:hypothetical protein